MRYAIGVPSSSATSTSMNPLNRSAPPRSWTQTGVQVPILNVFDAFRRRRRVEADPDVLDLDLARSGGERRRQGQSPRARRARRIAQPTQDSAEDLAVFMLGSSSSFMVIADPCSWTVLVLAALDGGYSRGSTGYCIALPTTCSASRRSSEIDLTVHLQDHPMTSGSCQGYRRQLVRSGRRRSSSPNPRSARATWPRFPARPV